MPASSGSCLDPESPAAEGTLGDVFGIDGVDLILILVLAIVLFGPERLPEYSRKAARIFVYLRDIANNAKNTLSTELGPEYADLELKDLNPRTFVTKHMREEIALIDEAKRELEQSAKSLQDGARDLESAAKLDPSVALAAAPAPEALGAGHDVSPFDSEAT